MGGLDKMFQLIAFNRKRVCLWYSTVRVWMPELKAVNLLDFLMCSVHVLIIRVRDKYVAQSESIWSHSIWLLLRSGAGLWLDGGVRGSAVQGGNGAVRARSPQWRSGALSSERSDAALPGEASCARGRGRPLLATARPAALPAPAFLRPSGEPERAGWTSTAWLHCSA